MKLTFYCANNQNSFVAYIKKNWKNAKWEEF